MNQEKKLYRSEKGQIVGGVCAGFADYFNLDVTLVRVLWGLASFFNGVGIIVYIIALILVPKNPEHANLPPEERKKTNAGFYVGIALIFIGISIVFEYWFGFDFLWHFNWLHALHIRWEIIWPVLLILAGVWYIVYTMKKEEAPESEQQKKENKKLFRSREDKMIAGVCGGLANFWNADPTLVRVGYVVLTVLTEFWLGIIAYFVLVIAVDEIPFFQTASDEPSVESTTPVKGEKTDE